MEANDETIEGGDAAHGATGHGGHDDHHEAVTGDGELFGVLAEYRSPGELITAARKVRDAGYTDFDCYSPFPIHGIDEAMGIKRTILPLIIFGGGLSGLAGGMFLQWWMNAYNWPWNISGKPSWSIPANIPIGFETTILASVLTAFFAMWILNKLPQVWHPFFRLDRFVKASDDGFLLGIEANDKRFDLGRTTKLLQDAGAEAVEPCYVDPDPKSKTMPMWVYGFIIATTVLALIPFALVARARASKSPNPHYHIFADMDFQPKAKSDSAFELFPDGRANRGEIPGTVARGSLNADDHYYRGIENGKWALTFPRQVDVDQKNMAWGKQRFEIYCAPCHGFDGQGNGAVVERSKRLNMALNAQNLTGNLAVVTQPNGQIFNTISNGYNTMAGYAAQIPVADRWAIVLYVRALQRSQHATQEDVPADRRGDIR
jgi:mono/diheme cytochrome c family protein